jgi:SAM-dependent methyltransferase
VSSGGPSLVPSSSCRGTVRARPPAGVGRGSVARALRALDREAEIVGVELNPEVLRLARRHFDLDRLGVELVAGDALEYLRRGRRRFDLIVEDLFVGPSHSVRKPDWVPREGYRLIRRRLRRGGYAVSNTIHETPAIVRALRPFGGGIVSLDVRGHWNRILMCGPGLRARELRRRLRAGHPELARKLGRGSVRARTVYTGPSGEERSG